MNKQKSLDIVSRIAHQKRVKDFNMNESSKYRLVKKHIEDRPIEFFRSLYWEITGETTRKSKQQVLTDLGNLFLKIARDQNE